jgi:hypothetical protein
MYAKELPRTPAHSTADGVHAREYIDVQECTPGSTLMSRSARQGVHRRPGVHAREYIDVQECTPEWSTLTLHPEAKKQVFSFVLTAAMFCLAIGHTATSVMLQ